MSGKVRARAPVARITALALSARSPPAFSATVTPGAGSPFASVAVPSTTLILCFFIRNATPPESCLATARDRAITLPKS